MQEEYILEEGYEFGESCRGGRYMRKNIEDERGESCSELEGREPCTLVQLLNHTGSWRHLFFTCVHRNDPF
jgi:hypothetical protein